MWCSSFENSFLWIAGTRPSSTIQLVYTLCGSELEAHLSDFLQGVRKGNLGELSARQLNWVNDLHCKIVREEDKISRRLENLQEEVGEEPLELEQIGESNGHVYQGLNEYMLALASIMEDADELRLKSLKELMSILSPLQGVNFMVASKKLYLSMHEWGKY
ncbi:hypothetical protein GIB67_003723 [Kingdonia uniflora]|nr:hypothetical protein GIB67_003723 [Kingdonia uniflora]